MLRTEHLCEFATEHSDAARAAASGIRNKSGVILATDPRTAASIADRCDRESPSATMWNCNLHNRFMRRDHR